MGRRGYSHFRMIAHVRRLLQGFHDAFRPTGTFEFSVEIDPTDASDDVLEAMELLVVGLTPVCEIGGILGGTLAFLPSAESSDGFVIIERAGRPYKG